MFLLLYTSSTKVFSIVLFCWFCRIILWIVSPGRKVFFVELEIVSFSLGSPFAYSVVVAAALGPVCWVRPEDFKILINEVVRTKKETNRLTQQYIVRKLFNNWIKNNYLILFNSGSFRYRRNAYQNRSVFSTWW